MADLDIISVDEARDAISASSVDNDSVLQRAVTAISQRFDELIGPVVSREVIEVHDGGACSVRLRCTPVLSVTSVEEFLGGDTLTLAEETFGTTPAQGFLLDQDDDVPHLAQIVRRSGGCDWRFEPRRRNVRVTFQAGRFASTDAVGERYRQAAARVVADTFKRDASVWHQSSDIIASINGEAEGPRSLMRSVMPAVMEFLHDQKRPVVA